MVKYVESRTAAGEIFTREENDWRVRTLIGQPGRQVGGALRLQDAHRQLVYEETASPETIRTTSPTTTSAT